MLIRPISIFVFGVCGLQAWNQMKMRRLLDMPHHPSDDTDTDTTNTPCANTLGWKEPEPASFWTNNQLWSSNGYSNSNSQRQKQQLPPYPGGWGRSPSHVEPAPEAEPTEDNPQLYGWEPSSYPDPLVDPVRCGVAYLPQPAITPPTEDASSALPLTMVSGDDKENDKEMNTPPLFSEDEVTAAQAAAPDNNNDNNRNNDESLRLCDPDWVLGGMYLEEIAMALSNFSTLYGDWTTVHANYWTRRLQSQPQLRSSPSQLRRHLDGPSPEDIDPHVSMEAAASVDGAGSTARKSTGPAIELAVATVRKVCIVLCSRWKDFVCDCPTAGGHETA
jgi:hypothetical protein